MKKSKKDEKTTPKADLKKAGRREFLERTGLTAGGVLMTTLAAGSVSKGAQGVSAQQRLIHGEDFRKLLNQALTDKAFQNDIRIHGFKALEARGYQLQVPQEVQTSFESALEVDMEEKPACGVCGVCGLCGLCAEINAGSASAALWALFALA
jgi:hypothetical protein